MPDDPRIKWELASPSGIVVDEGQDAWWSGHVTDVLEVDGGDAGLLLATEMGGVWSVPTSGMPIALSHNWDMPDVNCLAAGPDGPRHFFAGCDGGIIYETDESDNIPLLSWKPVAAPLPVGAGNVNRISILRSHRRIIAACDGGLYWSEIPATPPKRGCLCSVVLPPIPRAPYAWRRANEDNKGQGGYFGLAIGSLSGRTEYPGDEDLKRVSVIAGGNNAGVFIGLWTDPNTLELKRATLLDDQDREITDWWFLSTGAMSVAVCERYPKHLYAVCAYPDGRLKMVIRSKDGGRRWHISGFDLLGIPNITDIRDVAGDQGHKWNNCIAVMPTGPGVVAFGWLAGVFLSPNEGKTWKLINGGPHLHPDISVVRFKPTTPDEKHFLYIGGDGGIAQVNLDDFISQGKVTARSDYNRNLPTHQCYSTYVSRQFYGTLSVSRHPNTKGWVSTGVQDNGNIYNTLTPGSPWRMIDGGDGGWTGFLEDGGLVRNVMGTPVRSARRQGANMLMADNGVPPIKIPAPPDPAGLLSPVGDVVRKPRFRNRAGQHMYAVGGFGSNVYGLFTDESNPGAYCWQLLGTVPGGLSISAVASHTGATVFVGAGAGRIFALDSKQGTSIELGVILPKPTPNIPHNGGGIPRIVTLSETAVYAILNVTSLGSCYILKLDGLAFRPPIGAGLPMTLPFYGIEGVFQEDRQVIFTATDDRVYMSEDGGNNWVQASLNLPRRSHCADLRVAIDSEQTWLYLSTFGRSLWRTRLHRVHHG